MNYEKLNSNIPSAKPLSPGIVLEIRGIGPVPSFKNAKRVAGLKRSAERTWQGNPTLITRPDIKARVQSFTNAIVSQLRSMCPTDGGGTIQECWKRFAIALLPRDDCWQDLEIGAVTTELVSEGQEGVRIVIERL